MRDARAWFAAIALLGGLIAPGRAIGQGAIGVQPTVGTVPDGIGLSATPAVSADRRYVRLSIGFGSSTVQGFQNINFPVGAVGMGGGQLGGGGGLGALGGLGGAGGNAGGGGGGPGVLTGMNGPIGPGGMGMPGGAPAMGPAGGYGPGFDDFSGPSYPDFSPPRRVAPRRSRAATRAKEKARAVASKAEARPDKAK